mgnify:CR=1 FL=1
MSEAMISGDPNKWELQRSDSISAPFASASQEGMMITPQPTHNQDLTT